MFTGYLDSAVGLLRIQAEDSGITSVLFVDRKDLPELLSSRVTQCIDELKAYFAGKRKSFTVELAPGGTPFQMAVWQQLLKIPYAATRTYKQLAIDLGDVKKIRAAGTANGQNPIVIIIPCHRVIGSDGSLVGYGGGLWRKQWLLDFESSSKQQTLFPASK